MGHSSRSLIKLLFLQVRVESIIAMIVLFVMLRWTTISVMTLLIASGETNGNATYLPKNILIFGGNGLMGSATVRALHTFAPGAKIVVANRGNWYWDSKDMVGPVVEQVICDRRKLDTCRALQDNYNSVMFDLVADFSGYRPEFIHSAAKFLTGRIGAHI